MKFQFQYACGDIKPVVIGKPAAQYFLTALKDMQVNPGEVNVEIIKIINIFY